MNKRFIKDNHIDIVCSLSCPASTFTYCLFYNGGVWGRYYEYPLWKIEIISVLNFEKKIFLKWSQYSQPFTRSKEEIRRAYIPGRNSTIPFLNAVR